MGDVDRAAVSGPLTCRKCHKRKPPDQFYRWRQVCKACVKQASKAYRQQKTAYIKSKKHQYYAANREKIIRASKARYREQRYRSRGPEHNSWTGMKARCRDKRRHNYSDYGGRGIRVCARWTRGENGMSGFECFLADMGPKPSPAHSIDRYPDKDGNYEPGNCRWATPSEQNRNQRPRKQKKSRPGP